MDLTLTREGSMFGLPKPMLLASPSYLDVEIPTFSKLNKDHEVLQNIFLANERASVGIAFPNQNIKYETAAFIESMERKASQNFSSNILILRFLCTEPVKRIFS